MKINRISIVEEKTRIIRNVFIYLFFFIQTFLLVVFVFCGLLTKHISVFFVCLFAYLEWDLCVNLETQK